MNFPFLDVDVPRSTSYGVYISQLIRLALVSSNVDDFNTRNKVLTAKLLRQEYSLFLFYPITLDLETWPNHLSFRFLIRVSSSSYSPMAAWIHLRTSSLVTWSLYEMFNSLR